MKQSTICSSGIKVEVLEKIIYLAQKHSVEKVLLFGSRARGDYKKTSDIDLAFLGGDASAFTLDVEEETATLLKFDIVDLSKKVQQELLNSIKEEGVVLYEKV